MNMEAENWIIDCSDEELANYPDPWEPDAEQMDQIYTLLAKGDMPELKWKCPGYHTPSPEIPDTPIEEDETKKQDEQDDFDFLDEVASPKLKIRNKGAETLKGSAKKKTTSLDGIISNIRRHYLLSSTSQ